MIIALQLALAPARAGDIQGGAGYDNGFVLSDADGSNRLGIGGRIQVRYEFADTLADGADPEIESRFLIPRLRFKLFGNVIRKELLYKLEVDAAKGQVALKDAFLDYALAPALEIRAGQFKRPFLREEITSSGKLAFADPSPMTTAFGTGRDIGVMVHSGYDRSPPLEWAVALVNGTGEKGVIGGSVQVDPTTGEGSIVDAKSSNVPDVFHPMVVARLGSNSPSLKGYSQDDLEGGPLRAGIAVDALVDGDLDGGDDGRAQLGADAIVKVDGFAATGEVVAERDQDGPRFADLASGPIGWMAQASWTFGKKLAPGARFVRISTPGDGVQTEALGNLSWYLRGHAVKWQNEGGAELADGSRTPVFRSQVQLEF